MTEHHPMPLWRVAQLVVLMLAPPAGCRVLFFPMVGWTQRETALVFLCVVQLMMLVFVLLELAGRPRRLP